MKRLALDTIERVKAYDVEAGDLMSFDTYNAAAKKNLTNIRLVLQVLIENDGSYSYMMLNVLGNFKIWKLATGHKINMLIGFMKVA